MSTQGKDAWSGRLAEPNSADTDGPFATLERARNEIRKLKQADSLPQGGVNVELRGGTYTREGTFTLSVEDSGTEAAPIIYQARPGEEVRLVGGKQVTNFTPVTDPAILARLDEATQGNVLQADLKAHGITDFGAVTAEGGRLEVFFQDRPLTLARWPNEGFVRISKVVDGKDSGKFIYQGERPRRWAAEKDIWMHGYWFYDWSDSYQDVASIDTEQHQISLASGKYGYGLRDGQRFYALNVFAELDLPGEWYFDRGSSILYLWPPAALDQGQVVVSLLAEPLVVMKDVAHVTLVGLTFEITRSTAVVVSEGRQNLIAGCTLRNTGTDGISINGGTGNGVVASDIYQIGSRGIWLGGGNRRTLTPSGNYANNNHIHHFSRLKLKPGVELMGVGNRVTHNRIHDAPHQAVVLSGNDHLVELNEVFRVCTDTNDAGAFYMGRNPSNQGNVVRHNFWHHIGNELGGEDLGTASVYLDDGTTDQLVFGNVFYKANYPGHAGFGAIFVHGGKGNRFINNIFVQCPLATGFAPWDNERWQNWLQGKVGPDDMKKRLYEDVDITRPPYSDRYPHLAHLTENASVNIIRRNVVYDCDEFIGRGSQVEENNWLTDSDPGFVDAKNMNFQLRDDSPVYEKIPEFKKIPFEQIGLVTDQYRTQIAERNSFRSPGETD